MKIFNKIRTFISLLLFAICLISLLFGCSPKMREEGNFTYWIYKDNDGTKHINIAELTELGKQQKVLVIPEEIDGIKVQALHKWELSMQSSGLVWKSENLERVFFLLSEINVDQRIFSQCSKLKKIIGITYDITDIYGGGLNLYFI